jgi:DNA-directed RNA polymerase subunit E'
MGKIGITCRQPFLGALDWVEREIKRAHDPHANVETSANSKKSGSSSNIMSPYTKKDKK